MHVRATLRRLELVLLGLGLAAAAVYICLSLPAVLARNSLAQHPGPDPPPEQDSAHEQVVPPGSLAGAYLHAADGPEPSAVIGQIRIPALRLEAPVVEGVDDGDLRKGVGHVIGSALSGGLGNMILAAHRDKIFRPIRSIQKGMDVQVEGANGTFHYAVDSFQIVPPDRLEVMEIASEPQVTLITCYPFNFIGQAPMRFIVKAHLVSALPDARR